MKPLNDLADVILFPTFKVRKSSRQVREILQEECCCCSGCGTKQFSIFDSKYEKLGMKFFAFVKKESLFLSLKAIKEKYGKVAIERTAYDGFGNFLEGICAVYVSKQ